MKLNLIASMIVSTTLLVASATAVVAIPDTISPTHHAAGDVVIWK